MVLWRILLATNDRSVVSRWGNLGLSVCRRVGVRSRGGEVCLSNVAGPHFVVATGDLANDEHEEGHAVCEDYITDFFKKQEVNLMNERVMEETGRTCDPGEEGEGGQSLRLMAHLLRNLDCISILGQICQ